MFIIYEKFKIIIFNWSFVKNLKIPNTYDFVEDFTSIKNKTDL